MSVFSRKVIQLAGLLVVVAVAAAGGSAAGDEETIPDFRGIGHDAHPSVHDVMAQGQLGGPLHPTRPVPANFSSSPADESEQNLAFGEAMSLWNTHRYPEARGLLQDYVERFRNGLWEGEAVLHMACEARFSGRLREADQLFASLLDRYAASPDSASRMVAEKAKSRLAEMRVLQNSHDEASTLFSELAGNAEDWRHRTYASHWIQRLSLERHQGEALADCGSQALAYVLEKAGRYEDAQTVLGHQPDDARGFSLADLSRMAEGYGYAVTPLRTTADDLPRLPLPAIAHIERLGGAGHYWVLETLENDRLTIFDAQENRRFRQSLAEFSREWDGNLIVFSSADGLPGERLAAAEAEEIFGGCCGVQRPESDLGPPDECDANSRGCPTWSVNRINLNLYVTDTPLWYRPAFGPEVAIKLSYNAQSAIARNEIFGNKWSFGYGGYVVEDPGSTVTVFLGNGRRLVFARRFDGSYAPPRGSYEKLVKLDVSTYELHFRDGTVHRFAIPEGTASQQPFLTRITDPRGHALTFAYDDQVRLVAVIDAQGRRTALKYDASRRVVGVADPFGREARLAYDAAGNLAEIVDMGGYASQFSYDRNVYLTSLTKPEMGTWRFYVEPADGVYNGSNPYPPSGGTMWQNYRITVTDPEGKKEEFHYDGYHGYSWYVSPRDYAYDNSRNNYLSAPKTTYRFSWSPARITTIRHPNEEQVRNTYDYYGSNTSSSDGVVTVRRTYNSAHQKISETRDPNGAPQITYYEYLNPDSDLPVRIRRESVAAGKQFEQAISYDDRQNPVEVAYQGYRLDGTQVSRVYRYTYNSVGQLLMEDGPRTDVADETRYSYYAASRETRAVIAASSRR